MYPSPHFTLYLGFYYYQKTEILKPISYDKPPLKYKYTTRDGKFYNEKIRILVRLTIFFKIVPTLIYEG